MRADRLIALLLLLQRRGTITAGEAAVELEVSERTARRDLEALAMSGVPVYSRHGRGGGWSLVGGASTDLTGLSSDEARALFLAAGPAIDDRPDLESAMRKLTAALPETFREDAEAASAAIKVDPDGWSQVRVDAPGCLDELTTAVIDGHKARIDYEGPRSPRRRRVVHPLGLVTKRSVWYLVANTQKGIRTFRLDRVRSVTVLGETFERPPNFDLDAAWDGIVTEVRGQRPDLEVTLLVDPKVIGPLRWVFADRLTVRKVAGDGRFEVAVANFGARGFAAQIAGFGNAVELVDPSDDVIVELSRIARELGDRYGSPP